MTVYNLHSKRNKPPPDVYTYALPEKLRRQIVHIVQHDFKGAINHHYWGEISKMVAREHGLLELPTEQRESIYSASYRPHDHQIDCLNYILQADDPEALDMIEAVLGHFEVLAKERRLNCADVIDEINVRFRENGCGYRYENMHILRVDSEVLHAEVVQPALALLASDGFEGPGGEYLTAHEHYRHGRTEEAITEACKAFESTMKAICDAREWVYEKTAPASVLVKVLIAHGLVEPHNESGLMYVATIRNKKGGHGTGAKPRDVRDHEAAHALHLAAANIVFLVETHKALK